MMMPAYDPAEKNKLFWVLCATSTLLVSYFWIDLPLSQEMREWSHSYGALVNIFRAYTDLGKAEWWMGLSGGTALVCTIMLRFISEKESRRIHLTKIGQKSLLLFVYIALTGIAADIIKPILGRARPVEFERHHIYGFHPFSFGHALSSMPSGHSTTAVTVMLFLLNYFPRLRLVWFFLGFALCVSRIIVNAHYLSDVIAGGLLAYTLIWNFRQILEEKTQYITKYFFPRA